MEEAKRIIRYILPGMVYIILLSLTFAILRTSDVKSLIAHPEKYNINIAEVFGIFVLSGGLGYIFSIIYFGLNWLLSDLTVKHVYNHRNVLQGLISSDKLEIIDDNGNGIDFKMINRRDAWYITNVLWHSRTKWVKSVEGVHLKLDSYYSDLTTGLATTLIAAICSFVTFLILKNNGAYVKIDNSVGWCILGYLIFILLVFLNYYRTYKAYETMINSAIATEITKEKEKVKFIYSKSKLSIWKIIIISLIYISVLAIVCYGYYLTDK
ncbi:MAG: hypothetical protein AB7G44_04290 [Bacteroidia bacterium]